MDQPLEEQRCEPVTEETKALNLQEEEELLSQVEGWFVDRDAESHQLDKEFAFVDFNNALSFVNRVGAVAQQENHHPDILIHEYNRVAIRMYTLSIKGLHKNDFILAAKIDKLVD